MSALENLSDGLFTQKQWIRCLAHILNLAVQSFLKEMKATVKEFRDYMKNTSSNRVSQDGDEDSAFLKV